MRTATGDAGDEVSRSPFRFSLTASVELADTDLYGVVYYGRYTRLFDRAVAAYRRHLDLPPLGVPDHFPVVRRLEVEYLASARYGDALMVFVRVSRIGETSLTVDLVICRVDAEGPEDLVIAQIVAVGLDEEGRPSPVPAETRAAITAFEGGAR